MFRSFPNRRDCFLGKSRRKSAFSLEVTDSVRRELAAVGGEGCIFNQLIPVSRQPGWVNGRYCTSHWKESNTQDMLWEKENVH